MLNISDNNEFNSERINEYDSFTKIIKIDLAKKIVYWVMYLFILVIVFSFLPWTQNISCKGYVTTLNPEQKPQSVYSTIAGKIDKWYVREGQSVRKGDTLVHITEIKVNYFDTMLIERTMDQINAKTASKAAYLDKVNALNEQLNATQEALVLKSEQLQNKIKQYELKLKSDSFQVQAAQIAFEVANKQYLRTDTLYEIGIKSLTELENKTYKMQESKAKLTDYQNKYLSTQNDLLNAKIEINSTRSEYQNKIAKIRSDIMSALSNSYDTESQISKLQNTFENYKNRRQFYYILAPQDGYVTEILKKGISEIVKDAEPMLKIMPLKYELAVEMMINPMDYPLLHTGQRTSFIFDGWPAFVFSGWPNQSFGTFQGTVLAIDNVANKKGKYRVLVVPDESQKVWPDALRVGTGASCMVMLTDVPIWYELWRQLNGFPPEFYTDEDEDKYKLKAPVKQFKK